MKVLETLDRNPLTSALANSGQARIVADPDEKAVRELKAELETFVSGGQYGTALETILRSYLTHLDRPRQHAAWVSGFFGSGKSHLLKILGHLWVNTEFADGSTARSLVRGLPQDVEALLRELDTQVKRSGAAPIAAAGTLPAGSGDNVRLTVLSVILHAAGFPRSYPQARFCFWLKDEGHYEAVRGAVEAAGKSWVDELDHLYVSPLLASAVLECDPDFARDPKEARQVLRDQFPQPKGDIGTDEFLRAIREALAPEGALPLTALILDEVQQFIGDSKDRAATITEIAEAVQTQLDSRVMLVMAGQSALSATPNLQWLQDRFQIRIQLSDADVEAVTRKVLLQKKPSAVASINKTLDRNAGEISKHLRGTRLAPRPEDRDVIVQDYPLLPTRRRLWEECFRVLDAAGTHSQLRSQLRILHGALQDVAEKDLGAVIPADTLYEAIAPDLLNTGVLLNEISTRIENLDDGSPAGGLRKRIAGLVFLLNKLPREEGVDVGVRATPRMLADLLITDLEGDSGPLRKQVERELEELHEAGVLMKVGEEYRIQTTEGAEWDRAFRERSGVIGQNEMEVARKREELLAASVQKEVGQVRLQHGAAKLRRTVRLHAQQEEPPADGDELFVWMQDGWTVTQKSVEDEARRRGLEDPVIHLFLPKKAADDLRKRIVEAEAAKWVLDIKGVPTSDEGREARRSMESRLASTEQYRDDLVRDVTNAGRVFQGGGAEVYGGTLQEKIRTAAEASLSRLFPRFDEGDHRAWEAAIKRSRDGSDQPLKVVGWDGPTENHPVVAEVLSRIGSGAEGGDLRRLLKSSPFGWPQDAIDAALLALHQGGTIRVTLNGTPVAPGRLDQNKIAKAVFHIERVQLGTQEKLQLRGLMQDAGISVRSGEEEPKAAEFLKKLESLAEEAGGDPPLPTRPDTQIVQELLRLAGNERLAAILARKDELRRVTAEWRQLAERAGRRVAEWKRLERLAGHAEGLAVMEEVRPEIEAMVSHRSLLDESNYLPALQKKLEDALRQEITRLHGAYTERFDAESDALADSEDWQKLEKPQQLAIARRNQIELVDPLKVGNEEELLNALDRRDLEGWRAVLAALPKRFADARADAARELEPKTQSVSLRSDTLRTEDEVKAWLSKTEEELISRLADGPIVIG